MKFKLGTEVLVKPGCTSYDNVVGLVVERPYGHSAGPDAVFLQVERRDKETPLAIHPDFLAPYPYPAMTYPNGARVRIAGNSKCGYAARTATIDSYNFNREAYNVIPDGRTRTVMVKEGDLQHSTDISPVEEARLSAAAMVTYKPQETHTPDVPSAIGDHW